MTGWGNSDRRSRLPADWPKRRARILRRDPTCRIVGAGCTGLSTEVDHIQPSGSDEDWNLQGVCAACHARKTIAERRGSRLRPRAQHPGIRAQSDAPG